jgi:ribonuclease BN (tRNA processing enzyme)
MSRIKSIKRGISRRKFIQGLGVSLATAPLLGSMTSCETSGSSSEKTELVLLGTTGGITWWPSCTRTSSSSVLSVKGTWYLIDLGQGSTTRLAQAFNVGDSYSGDGSTHFLQNLRALFLTHLHQDHTADYPNLLLIGPGAGLTRTHPLKIFGPCNRGQLEINNTGFDESQVIYTDNADPTRITPTPGTQQMTETIWQAYAQTINNMTLDSGYPDFRNLVTINEIGTPLPLQNSPTCPPSSPIKIYEDDLVEVHATLVDHHQVYPAFAFRFDTDDGSVVFSGDTGPNTNGNLQLLADGANILVHEMIDQDWINFKFGYPAPGTPMFYLKKHMLEAHTSIANVGIVASDCRVKTLVLNHIVPGDTPISHLASAKENFTGQFIIGEDLMRIEL